MHDELIIPIFDIQLGSGKNKFPVYVMTPICPDFPQNFPIQPPYSHSVLFRIEVGQDGSIYTAPEINPTEAGQIDSVVKDDRAAKMLHKSVVLSIGNAPKLKYSNDCTTADYNLRLRIQRLDAATETSFRRGLFTGHHESVRKFGIGVTGDIAKRGDLEQPKDYSWAEERLNLDYTIDSVVYLIMYDLQGTYVAKQ